MQGAGSDLLAKRRHPEVLGYLPAALVLSRGRGSDPKFDLALRCGCRRHPQIDHAHASGCRRFCRPRKFDMQRLLVSVSTAAAIALFAPPSAVEAQSHTKPVIAPASRTINLTAEQSFIIKGIVLKDLNVPKAQAGAPESIGDSMPSSVPTDQDPGCGFWGFWYTRWA
jgi:hypothetical protein